MRLHQRIRRAKLQGEQIDITFPRKGRPSRFRRLERAGQMRLSLHGDSTTSRITAIRQTEQNACHDAALGNLFEPWKPLATIAIAAGSTAVTPENPITDADVPF